MKSINTDNILNTAACSGVIRIMQKYGIKAAGIPIESCRLTRAYKLQQAGFEPRSVCMGIIPYYTPACDGDRTVSAYAVSRDYHLFIKEIGEIIIDEAKRLYPSSGFAVFGDNSPIDERDAAAKAGLGIIGRNGMLITEEYSSYVFLFELITDLLPHTPSDEPRYCAHCGHCKAACPYGFENGCLSAVTQKKGSLTPEEERMVLKYGSVWGCDICQEVCPHTEKAREAGTIYTPIEFFYDNPIPSPTAETLADAEDLKTRAYSWRPVSVILRNIELMEKNRHND
ncbi:MAG: hypothetical protein MJ137_00785 [Clostridia bacterium]|nr:hypothetical protein [Clostridia bacterium]